LSEREAIRKDILKCLSSVIDPKTGIDVIQMQLIENVEIDPAGRVRTTFRPSSPLCPIAYELALSIKNAIGDLPEVNSQLIDVIDHIRSDELTEKINLGEKDTPSPTVDL